MTVSRMIARPMLASGFVVGGVNALRNAKALGEKADPVTQKLVAAAKRAAPQLRIPEDPVTLVRVNAGIQLLAAGALATGRAPRLSALVLAGSLVPTTWAGHRFWEQADAQSGKQQQLQFFKNVSMLGGLVIAAGDTNGKPGVAWRARRVAKDARREARHLTAAARQEAKLTRAKLT
jgi:putative oxidoreductase